MNLKWSTIYRVLFGLILFSDIIYIIYTYFGWFREDKMRFCTNSTDILYYSGDEWDLISIGFTGIQIWFDKWFEDWQKRAIEILCMCVWMHESETCTLYRNQVKRILWFLFSWPDAVQLCADVKLPRWKKNYVQIFSAISTECCGVHANKRASEYMSQRHPNWFFRLFRNVRVYGQFVVKISRNLLINQKKKIE